MTSRSDNDVYARVIRRVTWLIAVLGSMGAAAAGVRWGWRAAAGFALGTALSYVSFWRWRKITDALGSAPKTRKSAGMIVRFLLLAAAAYAIIKYLAVTPAAVLTGLLVAGAAVVVALILELIYART